MLRDMFRMVYAPICVVFLMTGSLLAVTGRVIHTFQGGGNGEYPLGTPVIDSAGNLFGSALNSDGAPLIYELSPSGGGWNYQVIYWFSGGQSTSQLLFDGSGNLYGTTQAGGANNLGTVFELTQSRGIWTANTLYSFGGYPTDGTNPVAALIFDSAGNLYGTTLKGGTFGAGTVFELSSDGLGGWVESLLYEFEGKPDGASPESPVAFDASGNLFGTTSGGGSSEEQYCFLNQFGGCGTLYELTPGAGGWTETVVHDFGASSSDGHWAFSGVIFDASGNMYGTTLAGGGGGNCDAGCGIAYGFSPGAGGVWTEHILANFNYKQNLLGGSPVGLVFDAYGNLYGAAQLGGAGNEGTIFTLRRNAHGFTPIVLYNFTGGTDGAEPVGVVFDAIRTHLYGIAFLGGNGQGGLGDGTVFVGHQ
ncbi:MAG TPA: choice-of-anchor tandem repeat GloVer-containing protein [Terriglobales bacterium]|nr:choice-of-anchor tandem repeat GloVer-containing protein [Terriglobales bacterium]